MMAIQHCHGFGNNQLMRLNAKGQLGVGERCIEADSQGKSQFKMRFNVLKSYINLCTCSGYLFIPPLSEMVVITIQIQ